MRNAQAWLALLLPEARLVLAAHQRGNPNGRASRLPCRAAHVDMPVCFDSLGIKD